MWLLHSKGTQCPLDPRARRVSCGRPGYWRFDRPAPRPVRRQGGPDDDRAGQSRFGRIGRRAGQRRRPPRITAACRSATRNWATSGRLPPKPLTTRQRPGPATRNRPANGCRPHLGPALDAPADGGPGRGPEGFPPRAVDPVMAGIRPPGQVAVRQASGASRRRVRAPGCRRFRPRTAPPAASTSSHSNNQRSNVASAMTTPQIPWGGVVPGLEEWVTCQVALRTNGPSVGPPSPTGHRPSPTGAAAVDRQCRADRRPVPAGQPHRRRRHGGGLGGAGMSCSPAGSPSNSCSPSPGSARPTRSSPAIGVIREARITAPPSTTPHAVTIYDVVDHGDAPCLIMQYVPSSSLNTVLRDRGGAGAGGGRPNRRRPGLRFAGPRTRWASCTGTSSPAMC